MQAPPAVSTPVSHTVARGLLVALLFVLPFSSSIALRNTMLAGAAALALVAALDGSALRPRLPTWRVLVPLLAYSAWSLASLAWSIDPAYSASELRPGLLYPLAAFLVFFAWTRAATDIDRWAWSLAAGLVATSLTAIAQRILTGYWEPGHWHGDAGFYATHVVLTLPLVAWLALRAGPLARGRLAFLAAVGLATLAVTSWNDNRIVWVALAAMSLVALALSWPTLADASRRRLLRMTALGLAAFALLFAVSVEQRAERLAGTPHEEEAQLARDPRPALWDYAARRHGDAPWLGHGYGRGILQNDFRSFVTPGVDNPKHTHAHNTPLNVLLQGGVVGLALFAWMVIALVREMAAGLHAGGESRAVATLGLALAAGFALRNLVDDFLVRHTAVLAWGLAGAVLGALRPTCARTPG